MTSFLGWFGLLGWLVPRLVRPGANPLLVILTPPGGLSEFTKRTDKSRHVTDVIGRGMSKPTTRPTTADRPQVSRTFAAEPGLGQEYDLRPRTVCQNDSMTLRLSPLFTDDAVLARDRPLDIWGSAAPGTPVTLTLIPADADEVATNPAPVGATTVTDDDGAWSVTVPATPTGGSYTLIAATPDQRVICRGLIFGDLWLTAGQSNMELPMSWVKNMVPWQYAQADQPLIRLFNVPCGFDFSTPHPTLTGGRWIIATPETIGQFTAAGYFFAQRVLTQTGVPIGLVAVAVGGTPVRSWTPEQALTPWPDEAARLHDLARPGAVEAIEAENAELTESYATMRDAQDEGLTVGWADPDFDDSDWPIHDLGATWEDTSSGAVWLRTTIEVPEAAAGPATLYFGAVVDAAEVWVDGRLVGRAEHRYVHPQYDIALPSGRVVIAIRILINSGQGEVTPGKLRLLHTAARDWNLSAETWRFKRGLTCADAPPTTTLIYEPAGLFNAMVVPLSKLRPTGMLWYQGESDADRAHEYHGRFAAMVQSWREFWPELPVIFTQLAHWAPTPTARDMWAAIRAAQAACLDIPRTAMVTAEDIGDANDLHPMNKLMLGDRLAWAALTTVYGQDLGFSPYVIRSAE